MQTTVQYQFRSDNQKAVKYGLPGNMSDRYQQFDPQMSKIFMQTEKCPFTTIRQLIIAFRRSDPYSTDVNLSDILMQKYRADDKLFNADKQLNQCIRQVQNSQIRFGRLSKCVNQYNDLYSNLLKRDEFAAQQQQLTKQTQAQFSQRMAKKKNEAFLLKQNQYFQYVAFSQQLQRGIIVASISQSQRFQPVNQERSVLMVNQIDNFRILSDFSTKMSSRFKETHEKLVDTLFNWRQKAKQGLITPEDYNTVSERIEGWKKQSFQMDQIYSQMTNFTNWLQRDREQLRREYQSNSKLYQSFLPQYIKVREIYEINSKNSYYLELIKEQKRKLQDHLAKNYGMIVPYAVSDQYAKAIFPIQNPKNRQLKSLIANQLTPLEDGLSYLNGQYQKLYKEVCDDRDGSSGVKRKIQDKIKRFDSYSQSSTDNSFAIHLTESCRKLLRIAK